jgi:hypothetical protein
MKMLAALALACAFLQGCASSPVSTLDQAVMVETPACPTAVCTVRNEAGQWYVERTPGPVTVRTSPSRLELTCTAPGGQQAQASYEPERRTANRTTRTVGGGIAGFFLMGMLLGPAVLLAPPALFVGATGAGAYAGRSIEPWQYPDTVSVPLACQAPA